MTRQILQKLRASSLRSRLRRRYFVWSAAIGVGLAIGYNVALPLLVSTTGARATMERMLDAWSGGKSRISGEPEIRFWPEPMLTLPSATIESQGPDSRELASIGRITASFSLLSALRGEHTLDDIRFVNPVITIERAADGTINWQRPHWLVPPETAIPEEDSPFGDIAIENGRLRVIDRMAGDNSVDIPGISGTVKWPSFAGRLSAQVSANVGGEEIAWAFVCEEPLALFARRNSPLKTSLTSSLLTFSFEGTGNLSMQPFASGHLQMSAPSLATLVAWYRGGSETTLPAGAFSIDAKVTTAEKALKLEELQLAMGGAGATGVLDIALPAGQTPRIEGTLAFDRIDLNGLRPPTLERTDGDDRVWRMAQALAGAWRADLRLSSQEVLVGPLHLTDVAAGVMIDGSRASLDIGDSTYANGSLSGRAVLSDKGLEHGGRLQMSLKDADFAAVLDGFGLKGPVPGGRGILNIDIATDHAFWATSLADVSGRLTYSLTNGSLAGFDVNAFTDLVRKGEFFSLSQASEGTFDFQTAEFEASFQAGTARLDRADFAGSSSKMSVTGIIPYRNGSLALAGALETAGTASEPLRFFVGGSWPNAVISPLSVLPK
ncbi:AsmA family protein [Sinorhizobium numidicum]|uniref:AsmA family protein n=1 Tax=Sinorhizobium numidicum TaxID=680248 RepID=A0ABY8D4L4_9HYPH|nr:AsmA family protein [Sinorhizobium numidicum]WEX78084.1 AsmA family protein [Sinorhizobium numidicum]WEX84743.1 AsmA family protein [Sinorhizobium numidicum]